MPLTRWQIGAIATVAVVVVASLTAFSLLVWRPAGSVVLEGVEVRIAYAPRSSGSIGPLSNDTCLYCPSKMLGGTQSSINVFSIAVPNGMTAWLNGTLSSVVPFYPQSWSGSSPPAVNSDQMRNVSITGGTMPVSIVLVVPDHPSESQTAFWIYLNVTAYLQPTR